MHKNIVVEDCDRSSGASLCKPRRDQAKIGQIDEHKVESAISHPTSGDCLDVPRKKPVDKPENLEQLPDQRGNSPLANPVYLDAICLEQLPSPEMMQIPLGADRRPELAIPIRWLTNRHLCISAVPVVGCDPPQVLAAADRVDPCSVPEVPVDGLVESLVEADALLPAQVALQCATVDRVAAVVPGRSFT